MNRYEWSARVLSASGPESPTMRLVLVALLTFYNEGKGYAWPGAGTLAERSGHCERTVRAALVEAEAVGWLRRDAMPGLVSHYYPTVPEDRELRLTPARAAGVGRQSTAGTPAGVAYDLRREPSSEASRKEGKPPPCPLCSAPMKQERSRRNKEPMFWGCTRFRASGCRGKLNFGEEPDPERERELAQEKAKNSDEKKAKHKADDQAAIERNRAMAEEFRKRHGRSLLPVSDAAGMAQAALSGALRSAGS